MECDLPAGYLHLPKQEFKFGTWYPIETMPKDGSEFLVVTKAGQKFVVYCLNGDDGVCTGSVYIGSAYLSKWALIPSN